MKSSLLLLLVVAALAVGADDGQGAFVSAPSKNSGASKCASVPEDGAQWLQPLCNAIHRVAAGEKEREVKVDDGTMVRSAKLWRNANGTTIDIDFHHGKVGSAVIARLLSGSAFIPTERVDQLVIRNASLLGTLDLSHATIEVAAKFDNVIFNSEKQQCEPEPLGRDALGLVLVGGHVKKQLIVEKGIFCGSINIVSSQLDGGLHLGRGPDTAGDSNDGNTAIRSLFILKSDVDGEIRLGPAEATGIVRFDRSTIDALTIVDTEFSSAFEVIDNHFGALSVWSSEFEDEVSIHDNAIESSMKLRVLVFLGGAPPVIRDNEIGGGLEVTIGGLAAEDADLSQNTVARSARIWLPQRQLSSLDLSGSVFRSRLALCLARFDDGTLHPVPAEVSFGRRDSCEAPELAPIFGVATAMAAPAKTVNPTVINLRSVEVGTLAWRLPLNCSFRWDGSGLRYQHWEETPDELPNSDFECREETPSKEDEANSALIGSTDGLMLMRHLMKQDDVDALNTMADYLESRGKIVESRDIREEAKRANYLNIPEQADPLDGWSRWAASWILAPVGYGAKPELSLIWLFGVWLFSYCVYLSYSYARRIDWKEKLAEHPDRTFGYSLQPGFMQFDKEKDPKDFDIFRYSIDAMLPVINLHTYDRYYPEHLGLRLYAALQHALGWFLITIFLVSAAIL